MTVDAVIRRKFPRQASLAKIGSMPGQSVDRRWDQLETRVGELQAPWKAQAAAMMSCNGSIVMELNGYVSGGVVVFDGHAGLPEGTKVRVVPVLEQQPRIMAQRQPPGATRESVLRLAGAISAADCAEMEAAINEGCAQTGDGR